EAERIARFLKDGEHELRGHGRHHRASGHQLPGITRQTGTSKYRCARALQPSRPMRSNAGFLYIFVAACGNDVATPPPDSTPTRYRDVEPIVQVHCDGCHAAGGIGPVQFTADTVVDQATNMAAQTSSRTMPPWQPALDTGPKLHGARVLD